MASAAATAKSIRDNITSATSWTPTTVSTLSDLLLPKSIVQPAETASAARKTTSVKASSSAKSKPVRAKSTTRKAGGQEHGDICEDQLSPRERSILATETINATLKSLTEAIKVSSKGSSRPQAPSEAPKPLIRKTLRRSTSLPQSPLRPRSLNRVASSPNIANRQSRSSSITSANERSTAEGARVAFACLRTLQAPKALETPLPPLQIENGMSVLIGKLLLLEFDDLALKEVRILKKRLDPGVVPKKGTATKAAPIPAAQTLSELLDIKDTQLTGAKLSLVIATQLQIIRLLASARKIDQIEAALPFLNHEHQTSPSRLILKAIDESKEEKQLDKLKRQLQSLSEILFSLCPSISSAEDALANSATTTSPHVSLHIQSIALQTRLLLWQISNHSENVMKEFYDLVFRCLSAFARRSKLPPTEAYQLSVKFFTSMQAAYLKSQLATTGKECSSLYGLYRLLGSLAKDGSMFGEAIEWTTRYHASLENENASEAKKCAVIARLVSLRLKLSTRGAQEEELLLGLLDMLEKPFKGDAADFDDLMAEVAYLRRATNGLLLRGQGAHGFASTSPGLREMCESFIFLCPRLLLRYLGNPPPSNSGPKDILRYSHRLQLITSSALHSIDSVLFLLRNMSSEGRLTWELLDSRLQECLLLYQKLDVDSHETFQGDDQPPPPYCVRISNLYYSHYLTLRRASNSAKDSQQLRALRRSVDCLQSRPLQERLQGCLWTKLERLADVYKQSGRFDELLETLITLRDELVEEGHLATVAKLASTHALSSAWTWSDEISLLGRTTQSIIKVEAKYLRLSRLTSPASTNWSEEEQAVVLENQVELISALARSTTMHDNFIELFRQLLAIYNKKDYPLRRLRVLLQLFLLEFESTDEIISDLELELKESYQVDSAVDRTKDAGLKNFLEHLKVSAETNLELRQENPKVDLIGTAISRWTTLREKCVTISDLEAQVDDVAHLLAHLESISDWLRVQGQNTVRLATLRLVADINELYDVSGRSNELVRSFTALGTQWLKLGFSGKAGLIFEKARSFSRGNGVSTSVMLQMHLSYAQYLLVLENYEKWWVYKRANSRGIVSLTTNSQEQLSIAESLYLKEKDSITESKLSCTRNERTQQYILASSAFLINSMLALDNGIADLALAHAKAAIRLLRHAWANIAQKNSQKGTLNSSSFGNTSEVVSENATATRTPAEDYIDASSETACGSSFWLLVTPLYEALNWVAHIYAHNGMFLETAYYLQEGHKLASRVRSDSHISISAGLLGTTYLKAGMPEKAAEYLNFASQSSIDPKNGRTRETALLAYRSGIMQGFHGNHSTELEAYDAAQSILSGLIESKISSTLDKIQSPCPSIEESMSKLSLSTTKVSKPRKTTSRAKPSQAKTLSSRPKAVVEAKSSVAENCQPLIRDATMILQQKSRALISMKQSVAATQLLQAVDGDSHGRLLSIDLKFTIAKAIFHDCLEKMAVNPDYSALQESTLSFPAAVRNEKAADRLSIAKTSPARKQVKGGRNQGRSKSPLINGFFERLQQAQEHLLDVYSVAISIAPTPVVHNVATLLNSVTILLSTFSPIKGKLLAYPNYGSCSIGEFLIIDCLLLLTGKEMAKNLSMRRERRAVLVECNAPAKVDSTSWPSLASSESRRSSIGSGGDLAKFQQSYIDIIPESWTAISIALSDSRDELSITKFQAGNSPFVLRLPLGRHNSMDADEDVFGFEQGRSELKAIIALANESAHDARDMSTKEAKASWWEEREALDARLRDLLENIEKIWLGGFTGIFSPHARRADLLARFQKAFHGILDKHLPSRRKSNKRGSTQRITLDSRILELFVGLGDASREECDFSEPLTDLLNFVVDVLHFHGEENEYSEIDFDSIVIETHDALRGYHAALNASGQSDNERHTILILDKALHCFPWESLPCMENVAVSRLPSLGALRDRILQQQESMPAESVEGHYINRNNGAYILNPGGDLKSTQSVFGKSLEGLNWEGLVRREPSEDEIKSALHTKDLYLYFGHGSGAQYIRAKEIRRLDRCAVSWLMGCSSGALTEAGEFEAYGPAMNYMHAGSPALVATLWDVTDKDIDRFAKSAFEHWGLFSPDASGQHKGKGKKKAELAVVGVEEPGRAVSLVEAVVKGREVCNLKYLNAAAVVVYGVPVYFG